MSRKFLFTDKKHSPQAVMSTVLGVIADTAIAYAIYVSYKGGGVADQRLGATGVIILVMATVGIILGYASKDHPDYFHLFSHIGIVLNLMALLGVSMILYAGAYGI
ncbi:MAG: DUF6142 family protein [Lachnospiraceae bacterium]|nr:DUF6142 family protein [Lachnospiraceae bacterium]